MSFHEDVEAGKDANEVIEATLDRLLNAVENPVMEGTAWVESEDLRLAILYIRRLEGAIQYLGKRLGGSIFE